MPVQVRGGLLLYTNGNQEHKGRDEERARALFNEVRGLAVDLANEHDSFDISLSISKIASEIFKSLPRATDQLQNDLRFLEER
jgi:hypothetical protein